METKAQAERKATYSGHKHMTGEPHKQHQTGEGMWQITPAVRITPNELLTQAAQQG